MDVRAAAESFVKAHAPKGMLAIRKVRRLIEAKEIDKARASFSKAIDAATSMDEFTRILDMFVLEKANFSALSDKVRERGVIIISQYPKVLLKKTVKSITDESIESLFASIKRIEDTLMQMEYVNLQKVIKTPKFKILLASVQTLRDSFYDAILGFIKTTFCAGERVPEKIHGPLRAVCNRSSSDLDYYIDELVELSKFKSPCPEGSSWFNKLLTMTEGRSFTTSGSGSTRGRAKWVQDLIECLTEESSVEAEECTKEESGPRPF